MAATSADDRIAVLFVCMGNICRSPTAEGVFTHLVDQAGLAERFRIDSAGTISYHAGSPPDSRAQKTAIERGYDISQLRARQIRAEDVAEFDYIVVMDHDNLADAMDIYPRMDRVRLLLDYLPGSEGDEVPDPYSGSAAAFDHAMGLIEQGCGALLATIRREQEL